MVIGALCIFLILAWLYRYKQRHPNITVEQEASFLYAQAGIVDHEPFKIDDKLKELDALNYGAILRLGIVGVSRQERT